VTAAPAAIGVKRNNNSERAIPGFSFAVFFEACAMRETTVCKSQVPRLRRLYAAKSPRKKPWIADIHQ